MLHSECYISKQEKLTAKKKNTNQMRENSAKKENDGVWTCNIPDNDGALYRSRNHYARIGVARMAIQLFGIAVENRIRFIAEKCQPSWAGLVIMTTNNELVSFFGNEKHQSSLLECDIEELLHGRSIRTEIMHTEPLLLNDFVIGYLTVVKGKEPLPDQDLIKLIAELIASDIEKEHEQKEWEKYTYLIQSERMKNISEEEQQAMVLGMAAHDLISPVNAITGYMELLQKNMEDSNNLEKLKVTYRKISIGVKDISTIVGQFGDYSKMKMEGQRNNNVVVNLNWILADLCDLLAINAEKQHLLLTAEMPESPLYIQSDVVKLKRVVMNLVSNSIKFCKKGGHIKVLLEKLDDKIAIRIIDDGVGIRKEMQNKIFKPFTQLPETLDVNDPGSLGLGLYITKRFVSQMNGHIDVKSEENKGSCFSIILPATKNDFN